MSVLTPEDQAFLAKGLEGLKRQRISGWVLLGLPWLILFMMKVVPGHFRRYEEGCQRMGQDIEAQDAELHTLKPATPIEANLAARLADSNKIIEVECRVAISAMREFISVGTLGLLLLGITLLRMSSREGRYLRIIRALSQTD